MQNQSDKHPSLTKSYKGVYPFKICTTSFIYPDHYIPNVKMLGPYMDEIELLFFESRYAGALPERSMIADLGRLATEFDISYNVHLPTDVSISAQDPACQQEAVETMIRTINRVQPLVPSALVLHVPYAEASFNEPDVRNWQDKVYQNLVKILSAVGNNKIVAIETLDYSLELLEDIIIELDLSVCLDLGHLVVYDYELVGIFNQYGFKTSVIHLHGVQNDRDHMALARLSEKPASSVLQVLKRFSGVLSLEVFSFDYLQKSLVCLENCWEKY